MNFIESISYASFEENYRKLGGLLFEDSVSKPGYTLCDHYYDPKEEIQISFSKHKNTSAEIQTTLDRLDDERKKGLFPCGILYYELGYHFIEGLSLVHSSLEEGTPLLHVTVYRKKNTCTYQNPIPDQLSFHRISNLKLGWDETTYQSKWNQTKEFLTLGESYELNLCFPVHLSLEGDLFSTYQSLKTKQKTKYSVYYSTLNHSKTIVSVSPELFFEVNGDRIMTEPMKGTIPRGNTNEKDRNNYSYLQTSEKERAENVMITDLYRNDLGRIAKQDTVAVNELFMIRGLQTVWQMVSRVSAELKEPFRWNNVLSALFPSGSVIGAPKRRSFELLSSLEETNRGVYTGAFFTSEDKNGSPKIRSSVTIRTLTIQSKEQKLEGIYGIGSGVTVLSDPHEEYKECLSKLKVLTNPIPPSFAILETLLVRNASVFLEALHKKRMETTVNRFGYSFTSATWDHTMKEIQNKVKGKTRVRLLLNEEGELHWEGTPLPNRTKRPMIRLGFAKESIDSDNVFLYHKTTNRSVYNHLTETCKELGMDDCILFDASDRVLETTIRNLFFKQKGNWYTPNLETGGLPGVFREWLLRKGWVKEKITTKDDLLTAEAILVGNSVRGFERVTLVTK